MRLSNQNGELIEELKETQSNKKEFLIELKALAEKNN